MAAKAYAAANDALESLVGSDTALVDQALESAAGEIDEALDAAGYATPVDLTVIADANQKARITARLAHLNRALAADILSSGTVDSGRRGQPTAIERQAKIARDFLEKLREGKARIPGLPTSAALAAFGQTGLHVVQRTEDELEDVGDFDDLHEASFGA